jgi:hypothetical protein
MQRIHAWIGLVVLACLPLQWFAVGQTPLGLMRVHQVVMLLGAALLMVSWRPEAYFPVLVTARVFVGLSVLMLALWSATSMFNGVVPRIPVQVSIYLVVFVVMGTYFYRALTGEVPGALGALRWSATAAGVVLVAALSLSMMKNGVNPIATLQTTIAQANPEILQKELFRSSFVGYGYDSDTVRGNIRHEVFGGVLLAMYVAAVAETYTSDGAPAAGRWRWVRRWGFALCVVLLLLSMSRAVLIAAAVWPLLALLRSIRMKSLSRRYLVVFLTSAVTVTLLAVTGLGVVILNRFTSDTASYEGRTGLYERAFNNIEGSFLTGGIDTTDASSHNFVIDAQLRGGIMVAACAAAILLVLLLAWFKSILQLPHEPPWMLAVTAAFALPLDRMLTAGGGLIPPVGWLSLALVAGAFTMRRRERLLLLKLRAAQRVALRV